MSCVSLCRSFSNRQDWNLIKSCWVFTWWSCSYTVHPNKYFSKVCLWFLFCFCFCSCHGSQSGLRSPFLTQAVALLCGLCRAVACAFIPAKEASQLAYWLWNPEWGCVVGCIYGKLLSQFLGFTSLLLLLALVWSHFACLRDVDGGGGYIYICVFFFPW